MIGRIDGLIRHLIGANVRYLDPVWYDSELEELKCFLEDPEFYESELLQEFFIEPSANVTFTNSGRTAIQLALRASRFPQGSEVIIPSFACSGVIEPILRESLTPVYADIDQSLNMSFESFKRNVGAATCALVLPSIGGVAVRDRLKILELAHSRDIFIIEDLAQSTGLLPSYIEATHPKPQATVLSMGIGKPLFGTGGGALFSSPMLEEKICQFAISKEPHEVVLARVQRFVSKFLEPNPRKEVGQIILNAWSRIAVIENRHDYSLDLNSIYEASNFDRKLANIQFGRLAKSIEIQRANAYAWKELFEEYGLVDGYSFPPFDSNTFSKFWANGSKAGRVAVNSFRSALWRNGIETESLYTPLHHREAFARFQTGELPLTDEISGHVFSLPVRANLSPADWVKIRRALSIAAKASMSDQ